MRRFAVFSDVHVHPHKAFAKTTKGGINSRLLDCVTSIQIVIDHCKAAGIEDVFFTGDLFQVEGELDTIAFNLVFKTISEAKDIQFYIFQAIMISQLKTAHSTH